MNPVLVSQAGNGNIAMEDKFYKKWFKITFFICYLLILFLCFKLGNKEKEIFKLKEKNSNLQEMISIAVPLVKRDERGRLKKK